jgi:hypothetical protein
VSGILEQKPFKIDRLQNVSVTNSQDNAANGLGSSHADLKRKSAEFLVGTVF